MMNISEGKGRPPSCSATSVNIYPEGKIISEHTWIYKCEHGQVVGKIWITQIYKSLVKPDDLSVIFER